MAAATPIALPAWSQRLISELDAADARAQRLVNGLTVEQFNWRPKPDAWSIGQCLQHLCLASQAYLPAIAASLDGREQCRADDIVPGWFGRWFIRKYIEPSPRSSRARAPRKIDPGRQVDLNVLDQFLRENHQARQLVQKASNYDVNRIRFRNPFIPLLRFTVGTGLEIICKHQRRHLLQAEAVSQSAK
ncbi:MAG TPA: DinB family protein [Bryobacteraceae bacterium]|nr:DinB family protein [Bryobacteraceae bacterium]